MLNSQLALNEFKVALEKARNDEEIWAVLSREYRNFGFTQVDLHIHGRHFGATASVAEGGPATGECWWLRVPLSGADFVMLHRPHHIANANTTMVVPFADVVRKTLQDKTTMLDEGVAAAV